jgi:NAD(P)H-hydrate epimerase
MKVVSVEEMKELDRRTIEGFGVPSIILMENAGKKVSEVALSMLARAEKNNIAVFCGTGNNGGDGFVASRHLVRQGRAVNVYIIGERSRIKNDALLNLEILEKMGLKIREISSPVKINADLIIDAIFGIGLKGLVKEPACSIIKDLNKNKAPIISIDVPSGLNADTGGVLGEAIKAKKTVTMQFPKKGFYVTEGPGYVGEIITADIGIFTRGM